MEPKQYKPGVGPTKSLNLRVSVACLVKVLYKNPLNGRIMLVLERTATLRKDESKSVVTVKAKPFGGGVRILRPQSLRELIGEFHFDSERSREQGDFRIQINPARWEKVKEICQEHLKNKEKGIIDPSPVRELQEEFEDSLGVPITSDDYCLTPRGMLVKDKLTETHNVNARGLPTVRIYYLFEAMLKDSRMIDLIIDNNSHYSDSDLQKMANEDARNGGREERMLC